MYVCMYGQAVNDNGDLMRMAIASPGNDFRFPLSGKSALSIRNLNDAMYVCMYVCVKVGSLRGAARDRIRVPRRRHDPIPGELHE